MPNAKADACRPFDDDELTRLLSPLVGYSRLLLAVSGGSDSLALLYLCHRWASLQDDPPVLYCATIDHGLREEARTEAENVASHCQSLGVSHSILTWRHDGVSSNIQAQAREARYELLAAHARSLSISTIALAHHRDDQAETLIMRLLRGSGVRGLGAMRAVSQRADVALVRPLLDVAKDRLSAYLRYAGVEWAEDPSNRQGAYQRVRVREMMPALAQEGADAQRLAATAKRMQRAEDFLSSHAESLFRSGVRLQAGRSLCFSRDWLVSQADEMRLRLLQLMLEQVAAPDYPPREERLERLDAWLVSSVDAGAGSGHSVGGCSFELNETSGLIWAYRAQPRQGRDQDMSFTLQGPIGVDWLGLYECNIESNLVLGEDVCVTLRQLGSDGRRALAQKGLSFPVSQPEHLDSNQSEIASDIGRVPYRLVEALPSVWYQGQPVAVVDWPEASRFLGIRVDFQEKNTRFTDKYGTG